jgi:lipid-A-disaccharide synthase-like uncharacterized protein
MKIFKLLPWMLYLIGGLIRYVYSLVDMDVLFWVGYGIQLIGMVILIRDIYFMMTNKSRKDP